ncbi:MAG: nucleotide exchange factor GrpE [Clostridia bacterium]|nr:nucleotide exchange factor GrpE [Clostridia bacterium]
MSENKYKRNRYYGKKPEKIKKETNENNEKAKVEDNKAFVDPNLGVEPDELSPPQDLNLKLQIEKENSIALTNMLKQLQADFENFRKRNQNIKKEAYDDGINTVIKRMLTCYDAICGALKSIKDDEVKKGLEILEREFLNAFSEFGVTPIKAEGEMFDANLHNAIASEEKQGEKSGKILTEVLKGFQRGDKVIRYSLVIISK